MTTDVLPDGVTTFDVSTSRLDTHVLGGGDEDGEPVVLIHGNVSSSRCWAETIAELPDEYRVLAPDLRGFGESETRPVDATRGVRDFADDLRALIEELGLDAPTLVGWSVGGGAAMQYAIDDPTSVSGLVLVNPLSPYGFGGTRPDGEPCQPDYAGTGGGMTNEAFVQGLADGDRSDDDESSPRSVLRAFYVAPDYEFDADIEDAYVDAMLSTVVGEDNYPGDVEPSEHWPGVAPGDRGVNNAISPEYCDLSGLAGIEPKPDVLWIRGAEDRIVADGSFFDAGFLGQVGELPEYPGEAEYPPQPMIEQTRSVLDAYQDGGGHYREEVIEDVGHSPHVERPDLFRSLLTSFLAP